MTEENETPEQRAAEGFAAIKRELEAKSRELADLRAELLRDRSQAAFRKAFDEVGVYPKAKELAVRTLLSQVRNLRLEGDELLGSWGDLEGVKARRLVEAFLDDESNDVFRPLDDEVAPSTPSEPAPPRGAARTLDGKRLPEGTPRYFHGKALHELPDEILLQMSEGSAPRSKPEPFKKPEGKALHELSTYELELLASQDRKPHGKR